MRLRSPLVVVAVEPKPYFQGLPQQVDLGDKRIICQDPRPVRMDPAVEVTFIVPPGRAKNFHTGMALRVTLETNWTGPAFEQQFE